MRPDSRNILGMRVDALDCARAVERVMTWARNGDSKIVCLANVHTVMEGHDTAAFRHQVTGADLIGADGMPLVWVLRLLGAGGAGRVYGPDLMLALCEAAARQGIAVGLYGGREAVLQRLRRRLHERYPALAISYAWAPPFRPLTVAETAAVARDIHSAGVRILFVGLGCPKQEWWMFRQRGRLQTVMIGVGAAFDFHAGVIRQAPVWVRGVGLEWLFRLAQEPRRLWRRYCKHNPRFAGLLALQLIQTWLSRETEQ